ncbi:MAG: hypothetical protein KME45_25420 [Stenomitos rutilans HA7619-LM2]|jgi:hypothetical protein|nr:hypothetical protein [Stenomitos rutilans HA7619-LM2]
MPFAFCHQRSAVSFQCSTVPLTSNNQQLLLPSAFYLLQLDRAKLNVQNAELWNAVSTMLIMLIDNALHQDRKPVSQPQFSKVGNPDSLLWVVRQMGKVRQTL